MYVIKTDGRLLYSPELLHDGFKVYSPKLHMEVNTSGWLEFTLPPCNTMYADIRKMKSIITVEQDGEEIFRGRVSEENMDLYRQKKIYCEGDLSFLLDSLQAPIEFEGTPAELFSLLIAVHNSQMEESKRFVVGDVSGLDNETVIKISIISFADTSSTIQTLLLDVYGGYLRTRKADGVYYIDYIAEYTHECTQTIKFGVNMLNIDSHIDAAELCTVLVPLGATTNTGETLTIAEVNDGSIYIENAELIARYGRIYKTYIWDQVTDPEQLMQLGQNYMQQATLSETLTIRAVDMHLIDGDIEKIKLGDKVLLKSPAHGLDRVSVCAVLDIDLQNGDQSEYTFGLPKQTMADQAVSTVNQLNKAMNSINEQHRWLTETDKALNITVENINLIGHRTTQLEIDVDAAEAAITLKASQDDVDILEEKHSAVELRLDAAEDAITAQAETISLQAEEINAKADNVRVEAIETEIKGLLKVENLQAAIADLQDVAVTALSVSGTAHCTNLQVHGAGNIDGDLSVSGDMSASGVDVETLTVAGSIAGWKGGTFVTNLSVTQNKNNATVMLEDGTSKFIQWVESVTITPTTAYINYMGKA